MLTEISLKRRYLPYQTTRCHKQINVAHNIKLRRRVFSSRLSDCVHPDGREVCALILNLLFVARKGANKLNEKRSNQ
jgi:hypothetical protein